MADRAILQPLLPQSQMLKDWCCPPPSSGGPEASDSNCGGVRALRCPVLLRPQVPKPNREAGEKRSEASQGVWKGRLRLASHGCSLCDHGPILVLERRLKMTFSC